MAKFSRQLFLAAVALNESFVDSALLSTAQSPWRAFDPVRVAAQEKVVERFYLDLDTHSAAKFSRATAIRPESVALVHQRIIKLLQLDGRVLYVALAHGNRRGRAV